MNELLSMLEEEHGSDHTSIVLFEVQTVIRTRILSRSSRKHSNSARLNDTSDDGALPQKSINMTIANRWSIKHVTDRPILKRSDLEEASQILLIAAGLHDSDGRKGPSIPTT